MKWNSKTFCRYFKSIYFLSLKSKLINNCSACNKRLKDHIRLKYLTVHLKAHILWQKKINQKHNQSDLLIEITHNTQTRSSSNVISSSHLYFKYLLMHWTGRPFKLKYRSQTSLKTKLKQVCDGRFTIQ